MSVSCARDEFLTEGMAIDRMETALFLLCECHELKSDISDTYDIIAMIWVS